MLKKSFLPLLFLFATVGQTTSHSSFFDDIEDEFFAMQERMMKQMKKMRKKSTKHFKNNDYPLINTSINEDKNGAIITVTGIEAQTLSANLNEVDNQLSIEADNARITIQSRNAFVAVTTSQEMKKEKEGKEESKQVFFSSSSSQTAKNISRPVDLEKQTIEYDADQKTLTITFAYQEEKKGKPVPVTMVAKNTQAPAVTENAEASE